MIIVGTITVTYPVNCERDEDFEIDLDEDDIIEFFMLERNAETIKTIQHLARASDIFEIWIKKQEELEDESDFYNWARTKYESAFWEVYEYEKRV